MIKRQSENIIIEGLKKQINLLTFEEFLIDGREKNFR